MLDTFPLEVLDGFAVHTGAVHTVKELPEGNNSAVWRVQAARGMFIVKRYRDESTPDALGREATVLRALTSYTPYVPNFLARVEDYFLFTGLSGVNLAAAFAQAGGEQARIAFATEYGRLLRIVHGWEPPIPRPDNWLSGALLRAEAQAREIGLDSLMSWDGWSHRAVWKEIQDTKHNVTPHIVFCHGDWCLPNVLMTDGKATGAVDWGDGGWADYRTDLATGLWSLRYNSTTLSSDTNTDRYLNAFLQGYGYHDSVASLRFWEALSLLM